MRQTRPLLPTAFSACACSPPQIGKTSLSRSAGWNRFCATIPAEIYAGMDFDTRNSYRSVIEELARHSNFSEEQVALAAVEFAGSVDDRNPGRKGARRFLSAGCRAVQRSKTASVTSQDSRARVQRALLAHPTAHLSGEYRNPFRVVCFGTAHLHSIFGRFACPTDPCRCAWVWIGAGGCHHPRALECNSSHQTPKPAAHGFFGRHPSRATAPWWLSQPCWKAPANSIISCKRLELYYLSNPDPQLTYALLTDFGDAPAEDMPEDEELLALARAGIENLNKKYRAEAPFYLFHRQRQWNPSEGVWMGWERKRGKLADFNRLLLDLGETPYTTQVGECEHSLMISNM